VRNHHHINNNHLKLKEKRGEKKAARMLIPNITRERNSEEGIVRGKIKTGERERARRKGPVKAGMQKGKAMRVGARNRLS